QSQTEAPTGERTLFSADISWDEESTQAELDEVKNTVMAVQVATIVGWVLAIIGAVLLLACAWRFSRQREKYADLLRLFGGRCRGGSVAFSLRRAISLARHAGAGFTRHDCHQLWRWGPVCAECAARWGAGDHR